MLADITGRLVETSCRPRPEWAPVAGAVDDGARIREAHGCFLLHATCRAQSVDHGIRRRGVRRRSALACPALPGTSALWSPLIRMAALLRVVQYIWLKHREGMPPHGRVPSGRR